MCFVGEQHQNDDISDRKQASQLLYFYRSQRKPLEEQISGRYIGLRIGKLSSKIVNVIIMAS